ncbi:hypothetical protein E4U26_003531 [Claviceps purpurea]|nr:hypothetical protein E4U26_003531 [Claviceps purpurea]
MSDEEGQELVTKPFKLVTGPDARFPNTNQTKHCWQNYVDYHKCINAKGEDFAPCLQVWFPEGFTLRSISLMECLTVLPRLPFIVPLLMAYSVGRPAR